MSIRKEGLKIPELIIQSDISSAWVGAVRYILSQDHLETTNLMVSIEQPTTIVPAIDHLYSDFVKACGLPTSHKIATFIFPQKMYDILRHDKAKLYSKERRIHKVIKGRWGSYFDQMVNWKESNNRIAKNQIKDIIDMINRRPRVYKAAYTIQITNPILHSGYIRGGPCLHYILLQLDSAARKMSLLAIYRNHDFVRKAYGNYLGLGNLLGFLASETQFQMGCVTCVSSHAYIENRYRETLASILRAAANG